MIHHVGVVASQEQAQAVLKSTGDICQLVPLGAWLDIPGWECRCRMYRFTGSNLSAAMFELVVPYGGKLLEWNNNLGRAGIHHIALAVNDVREECRKAAAAGREVLSVEPVESFEGSLVNFIKPDGRGILLELVEEQL